jgi:UDP-N-acetylmuramoylalanine--D-glutamate ligase
MGRSGCAAAEWLLSQKAEVSMFDEFPNSVKEDSSKKWESRGVRVFVGQANLPTVNFDVAILSPGISPMRPVVQQLNRAKIPVLGELELGARACLCPIVAVTGTNGKSTTTELLGALYQAAGQKAVACGNLGRPICEVAPLTKELDRVVVEVSSFQLESIEMFRPQIAVYLNLTPDHLDRYADMQEYAAAKERIFKNQKTEDVAVVRKGMSFPGKKSRTVTFTSEDSGADYTLQQGWLCAYGEKVMRQDETQLSGSHNAENLLAALAVADVEKISRDVVRKCFREYRALPHRCEVVAKRRGVTWVNDSKATNLDAMERAVLGMEGSVILIAGGKDKGFDFSACRTGLSGKVRAALLIGEMAPKILKAWDGCVPCRQVRDLAEAVQRAAEISKPGETVLLSPGCSSFDMFKNFEDRGEKYRQCVNALPKEETNHER